MWRTTTEKKTDGKKTQQFKQPYITKAKGTTIKSINESTHLKLTSHNNGTETAQDRK